MKELKIDWLDKCPCCNGKQHAVKTKKGKYNWLYDGDEVECLCCGHKGEIEADGEVAWVNWVDVESCQ